ncbi:MAG: hypothetical protein ACE5IJ_01670 [Thermoplasmata archaeon]
MKSGKKEADTENGTSEALAELLPYVRAMAASMGRERAQSIIDSHEKALAYSHMEVGRTDTDIANSIGVPRRTVTGWVGAFVANGLAVREGRSTRALFTLEELGINIGTLKKKRKKTKREEAKHEELPPRAVEEEGD